MLHRDLEQWRAAGRSLLALGLRDTWWSMYVVLQLRDWHLLQQFLRQLHSYATATLVFVLVVHSVFLPAELWMV